MPGIFSRWEEEEEEEEEEEDEEEEEEDLFYFTPTEQISPSFPSRSLLIVTPRKVLFFLSWVFFSPPRDIRR